MTRQISILLVVASFLLIFTGTTAAFQYLTSQQEMWLQLEISIGPFKYVPHPDGPETEGFTNQPSAIITHSKREIGDFTANYPEEMVGKPPEMDVGVFKSVNDQPYSGNPQDKPGPQRAPPNCPIYQQLP